MLKAPQIPSHIELQLFDLQSPQKKIRQRIESRMKSILDHGQFVLGPEVKELEAALGAFTQTKHAIACANGTDALLMAVMAADVGPDDEVITSPFSFPAAAEVTALLGAKVVFVDIDPGTYNLDPKSLAAKITKKTKAIIPVNLYGQCADYDVIHEIAAKHKIFVIEDAAQSFGAQYKGRMSGSLAPVSCVSFFPTKPLAAYGDAGAVFTNDDKLAEKLRLLRHHGEASRYNHTHLGMNSRMDSFQAAVLLEKLSIFKDELAARERIAKRYDQAFHGWLQTMQVEAHNKSAYALYTVELAERDLVQAKLRDCGVPTAVHYPKTIYQQPYYAKFAQTGDCPVAEKAGQRVLSLPMHPYLSEAAQDHVVASLRWALNL